MEFFYRWKPWYAGQFVRKITPKIRIPESAVLFLTTVLNRQKPRLMPVLVRDVDRTFRELRVQLPTRDGRIDFDFMASFVATLESGRNGMLSDYVKANKTQTLSLTQEEAAALEQYETVCWGVYNLKTLFGSATRGRRLKSADRIPGTLPFVTAGEAEEGVSAHIGNDVAVFEKNTTTIDMFGSAKYRNYRYGADDHIAVVHTEHLPPDAAIFVTAAIHKAAHTGRFDYGRNFYPKDADALDILLPSRGGAPDYAYMATLIAAVRKRVLGEIARYSERKRAEQRT